MDVLEKAKGIVQKQLTILHKEYGKDKEKTLDVLEYVKKEGTVLEQQIMRVWRGGDIDSVFEKMPRSPVFEKLVQEVNDEYGTNYVYRRELEQESEV